MKAKESRKWQKCPDSEESTNRNMWYESKMQCREYDYLSLFPPVLPRIEFAEITPGTSQIKVTVPSDGCH